jgi:hypothetical protein
MKEANMNIDKTFADIGTLIQRTERPDLPHDSLITWEALPDTLHALVAEAERFRLSSGEVRQQAKRLKHHLDVVFGTKSAEGQPLNQHRVWANGALWRLRGVFEARTKPEDDNAI